MGHLNFYHSAKGIKYRSIRLFAANFDLSCHLNKASKLSRSQQNFTAISSTAPDANFHMCQHQSNNS